MGKYQCNGENSELMNTDLVEYAISESKTLTIKTISYLSRERNYIDSILKKYLKEIGKSYLMNQISYCLHELAGNANRANAKRIYFCEQGLDIHHPDQYKRGLETFRADTFSRIDSFHQKQRMAGLYIKIDFQLQENCLRIRVRNNALLTVEEKIRIQKKFETMKDCRTIPEVYKVVEDSSEGAGLGLVMIIQLLQNLGFGSEAFNIDSGRKETVASILLNTGELTKEDIA